MGVLNNLGIKVDKQNISVKLLTNVNQQQYVLLKLLSVYKRVTTVVFYSTAEPEDLYEEF